VDSELEVIRHEMEDTRASLADKLDILENQVLGTVHDATAAVAHTVHDVRSVVDSVSESVKEGVESVKETLNLSEQVRRHPWGMLGGAAAVGFFGGWLMGPSRKEPEVPSAANLPRDFPRESYGTDLREKTPEPASESEESVFAEPLKAFKGLALGAIMGMVREMVAKGLPDNLKDDVVKVLDNFTTKIGGNIVPPSEEETPAEPIGSSVEDKSANGKHAAAEEKAEGGIQSAGQTGRKRGSRFR
jgi:ElaB/YqjD/DUF883 family membrane-anchored ribosome-binding protein